jgi:hypothetical protein
VSSLEYTQDVLSVVEVLNPVLGYDIWLLACAVARLVGLHFFPSFCVLNGDPRGELLLAEVLSQLMVDLLLFFLHVLNKMGEHGSYNYYELKAWENQDVGGKVVSPELLFA